MQLSIEKLFNTRLALGAVRRVRRLVYGDSRSIVISAMPKSGSTFLSNALAGVTGYEHGYAACAYGNVEQELYLPRLIDMVGRRVVVQQHFKANLSNLELLRTFGLRPVVQVRNLFDAIVSLRDHLVKENLNNIPALYPSKRFREFDAERQFDFLLDTVVPWYLSYYASWHAAAASQAADVHWVVYEDARADWAGTVRRVLSFHCIDCGDERVEQVLNGLREGPKSKTRMNVGVVGRGGALMSEEQRARVARMAGHYPDVDFRRIGIGDAQRPS